MKKILFALLLFTLTCAGTSMAQSQFQPVEGPIQPGNGQANQAQTLEGVVTMIGNEAHVITSLGETYFLVNGHGLLQGNQIQVGDVIWVTKSNGQDFNTSRSNKEKG